MVFSKNLFLSFSLLLLFNNRSFAQHTEYSILLGSGLFHYTTKKAREPYFSMINWTPSSEIDNYANYPYGNRNASAYQVSLELKKVTKSNVIWGGILEYEYVQSKKEINWVFGPSDVIRNAKGDCNFSNQYLMFHPFAGYRFFIKRFYWDVTGGLDLALGVSSAHQKGSAIIESTGEEVKVDKKSHDDGFDPFELRAGIQTEAGYKRWGIYVGYAWGFYKGHLATTGGKSLYSFSRYLRAGLFYCIR